MAVLTATIVRTDEELEIHSLAIVGEGKGRSSQCVWKTGAFFRFRSDQHEHLGRR